jgi:hypothetical protein
MTKILYEYSKINMNTQYLAQKYYLCSRQINRISIMNLLNFVANFPDEASCKAKWKEYRVQRYFGEIRFERLWWRRYNTKIILGITLSSHSI